MKKNESIMLDLFDIMMKIIDILYRFIDHVETHPEPLCIARYSW